MDKTKSILTKSEKDFLAAISSIFHIEIKYKVEDIFIDFAFPDIKLAIYLDGVVFNTTPKQIREDMDRDIKLESLGWRVLRFLDKELDDNSDNVLLVILEELKYRLISRNFRKI